ncbi:MAG: hypothetical protein HY682_07115 [Chloroflexi bacterium]|nr:hypothetical protein [Chloroflexota bacterium]
MAIILPSGMGTSRAKALDHAYQVLERPRAHMRVRLRQTRGGVSVLYDGRLLTKVYLNRSGMRAAMAIAQALGLRVPKLGETLEAVVSSGLLYRVIALSQIDYSKNEALELARHLLDEADSLRSEREEEA